ncbi:MULTISPECIES: CDP-alcohol phosphatidyltransferase family protein [Thermocrispum]|jgi:phosphatidylglycerophosphate synthase|uniref:CDP-alcohol phosphatidyltransferase n=1 Tax=Thermocrispum agreste TaxID=37925 RepID=A0A2W4L252_9PSEU|nr:MULTISPECIES: CDP-alcohol phosphatidyltransferase family protein [Thermocrispum]PZM95009.1 MAG: CDP-alcohol phosphatidyltransferase [Thermocrispum agreste]
MTTTTPRPRVGPLVWPLAGVAAQLAELGLLAVSSGLTVAGWLIGGGYGLVTAALLIGALRRSQRRTVGPADVVTLLRSTLVGSVAALAADSLAGAPDRYVLITSTAVVALALDAVDGVVARSTNTASPLGARFDMEVDASLLAVLSIYLVPSAGLWVVAIGGMRYAFVVAGWLLPWLRGPLKPTRLGKTVAAMQGIVLIAACSRVFPAWATTTMVAAALALLVFSFGRDIVRLWRARPPG